MAEISGDLKKHCDKYLRVRDLYNRLADIENDLTKFDAKPTDLETIRNALLIQGLILRWKIEEESGGAIKWE